MTIHAHLRQRLCEHKVIPFIGSGVSRAVRDHSGKNVFPTWRELLINAADRLEQDGKSADLVQGFLRRNKYLEAAMYAREEMGPGWTDFLLSCFNPSFDIVDEATLELANAIWSLQSNLIITTNYDKVLYWACPRKNDCHNWDIEAPANQGNYLQNGANHPIIWHLHGTIENAGNIILTPDSYSKLYAEGDHKIEEVYRAALATLRNTLASYTFLFIGFSMDDDAIRHQFESVAEVYQYGVGPHYILAPQSEEANIKSRCPGLEVITFENFGEPLLNLVRQLGDIAAERTQDIVKISDPSTEKIISSGANYSPENRPFTVPFRAKNEHFIGQEAVLQRVRKELECGRPASIGQAISFQGLGGLGKTQLAVEYAYRYSDCYPNGVIWLTADQDLDAQLTTLADTARWISPLSEHKDKLAVALQRVRSYSDCLVIFDNVEKREDLDSYLPLQGATPHLLITSRIEQPGFTPIPIDLLDEDDALCLLLQEAERPEPEDEEWLDARDIANKLGGLPLALEIAGAYLRHRPSITWKQYNGLLQHKLQQALQGKFLDSLTKHDADLYLTLHIADDLLEETPLLREILDVLTWSASAAMSDSLLSQLLGIESIEMVEAISLGVTLNILQQENNGRYSLHRLVREVRRQEIPLEDRHPWVKTICQRLGDWFQDRREDFTNLPEFEADFDHLQAWADFAESIDPEIAARLTWLQAYPPFHRGKYKDCQQLLMRAYEFWKQGAMSNQKFHALLLNDLGSIHTALGAYQQAMELYKQAIAINREVLGDQHSDTATSIGNLASVYHVLGECQQALELHTQALAIRREVLGDHHPDTTTSLNNLASDCHDFGEYQQALELHTQALAIRREILGDHHPDTATSIDNLASVYHVLGECQQALELHTQALAIRREVLGDHHPDTASSLNNLASVYHGLNGSQKAMELHTQALAICREVLGDHHPNTATSLNNLASVYHGLSEYQQALELHTQALAIRREVLGDHHPDTAISLNNLASVFRDLDEYQKALELQKQAVAILREMLGECHPDTIDTIANLAYTLIKLKRHREAINCVERYLQTLPTNNPNYSKLIDAKQQILANWPDGFRKPAAGVSPVKKKANRHKKSR